MPRPDIRFEILDAVDHENILTVPVYGINHRGEPVDEVVTLPEPRSIDEIAAFVGAINRGNYRP